MTAALASLAVAVLVLVVGLLAVLRGQFREREAWAIERRALVDRIIAKHSGEVIALDRKAAPKRSSMDNERDRPVPVGL